MHSSLSGQIIVPEPEAKHFAKIHSSNHQQHGSWPVKVALQLTTIMVYTYSFFPDIRSK
jgi:hypothetical protein